MRSRRTHLSAGRRSTGAVLLVLGLLAVLVPGLSLTSASAQETPAATPSAAPVPTPTPVPLPPTPVPTPSIIAGTVTGAGGAALGGVEVTVEKRAAGESAWSPSVRISNREDGTWAAVSEPRFEYRVSFRRSGYQTEWFDDATRADDAVPVASGNGVVNAQLKPLSWWQQLCATTPPGLLGRLLLRVCGPSQP